MRTKQVARKSCRAGVCLSSASSLSAGGQMSGGTNQPAAKRARRNSASSDGPVTIKDLPPDAYCIVFSYAIPRNDLHRLEFEGTFGAVCRSFRRFSRTFRAPWRFDLALYREYTPLSGPDREPRDCRLALLESLAKNPFQRYMVYCVSISHLSLEKEPSSRDDDGNYHPGRICNTILKALRALLAMEGAFPDVTSIYIDLCPLARQSCQETNVPLINKYILKKMPSAFPRLIRIRFGHCLDPDTLLAGNLVKFFQALKEPPKLLSLAYIPFLEEFHVVKILRCIGGGLTHLEIIGGGIEGQQMWTGEVDGENNCMYAALSAYCRQLQGITLSLMEIIIEDLGKVLDLEETLTELKLQGNDYTAFGEEEEPIEDDEAEAVLAGLFENKGKNLERFECDFRSGNHGGTALRNLIDLQKRMTTSGAVTGGHNGNENGNKNEGASQNQKRIKLLTANVGLCSSADICAAISDGVQTIGLPEWPDQSPWRPPNYLEEIWNHFYGNGVSIPSGTTLIFGNRLYRY